MRLSRILRLAAAALAMVLLGVAANAPAYWAEADVLLQAPNIPHPIAGHEDCLSCHGPGQAIPFPADHQGRTNDTCTACHQESPAVAATATVTVTQAIPAIPHTLVGREDCLSCHGPNGAIPFPPDHQGRTNDQCLDCHQPAQATPTPPPVGAIPTAIQEPQLFGPNSCVTCHTGLSGNLAQVAVDWQQSAHAANGVGCVSCHGGDPNQSDQAAAMSAAAGFLGVPAKPQVPGLCASCHSNVDLMRPFGLPTDQFDQYLQSQHGQLLATGDQKVATCFDCHGGHKILKAGDPGATVYPTNEPAMCAGCHANQALMQPYGIPTNQFALYQTSIHGVTVLQNQDLRAPTCSTCHGKHGAAPPGLTEVASVCGQCHSMTEQYYLQGAHKTGMAEPSFPACVTCHGQHDVAVPTLDLFLGSSERHCGQCHTAGSATANQVDAIYLSLKAAEDAYAGAQAIINQGTQARLLMNAQAQILQQANTPLIEAQALQHAVNVADIQAKAKQSIDLSQQATTSAQAALSGINARRIGMVITVIVILVVVLLLILVKRELDRELAARRRQKEGGAS